MNENSVIITDSLVSLGETSTRNYVAHAYCMDGSCRLTYNEEEIELVGGDVIIVRRGKLVSGVRQSPDFKVKTIYVEDTFLEVCTPQNNYGMIGSLALFLNPVMHLTPEQQHLCMRNMEQVEERWNGSHNFKRDMMIATVQTMFLDFFDFHVSLYGMKDISAQSADIMGRFLAMLNKGEFRQHREVTHYADALCVTPKYLSEVSKKVSGRPANYWINRYTALDISRLLRDKSLSFTAISDMFGFSSSAYFTRYVVNNLGMTPSEYRE